MFLETKDENINWGAFYDKALHEVGLHHRYVTISDWKFVVGHEITKKVERKKKFLRFRWVVANEVVVGHFVAEPASSFTIAHGPKKLTTKLHIVIVDESAVEPIRKFCKKFEERFDIRAFFEVRCI